MKSSHQMAAACAVCALLLALPFLAPSGEARAATGAETPDRDVFFAEEPSYFLVIDECFLSLESAPAGQLLLSGVAKAHAEMGRVGYRHIELQEKGEDGRWYTVATLKDDTIPFKSEHAIRVTLAPQSPGTYRVRAIPFASDPGSGNNADDHRVIFSNEWIVS